MARVSPIMIYHALLDAGFGPAQALIMVAIAGAETGGSFNDTVLGDVSLENNTWGPSVGVFQIRTLKQQTGRGTDRDIAALQGNLSAQAKAAYHISSSGRDFTPWSTYTSGKYQQYYSSDPDNPGVPNGRPGELPNPVATNSDGTPAGSAGKFSGWKAIVIEGLFAMLGLGVTVAGLKIMGGSRGK